MRRILSSLVPAAAALALVAGVPPVVASAAPTGAASSAGTGIITTFAGGPGEGRATEVSVCPTAVAVREALVYMTDSCSNVVRALDTATGMLRVVAGNGDLNPWAIDAPRGDGGPATAARLARPMGLAVDAGGRVYFGGLTENAVNVVDASGIISIHSSGGTPNGLTLDGAGNLYSAGTFLLRISPTGETTDLSQVDPCCADPDGDGPVRILRYLTSVAVDSAGNLYVTERNMGMVHSIDPSGTLTTLASGLRQPDGITRDAAGNLYFAEVGGNRIRKLDPSGTVTTVAGGGSGGLGDGGPALAATLSSPGAVAVAPGGDLYIADSMNARLRRVDTSGTITTVAGNGKGSDSGDGGPARSAQAGYPSGVAVDRADNVYLADSDNHRVRKVDRSGVISTVAGTGQAGFSGDGGPGAAAGLFGPTAVAVDSGGRVYVADRFNNRIRRIDASGVITTVAGGGEQSPVSGTVATQAAISRPFTVAVDSADLAYFADEGTGRVWRVERSGVLTLVAGGGTLRGDGVAATSAWLAFGLKGTVAVDKVGNVYVSDSHGWPYQARVRKIDPTGVITTVVGGGSENWELNARGVLLSRPPSFTLDASGNLFIGEWYAGRVYKVDRFGVMRLVAGTGQNATNLGDGGPAVDGRLAFGGPNALAVDSAGNLYIADASNRRIRKVSGVAAPESAVACGWNGVGQLGTGSTTDVRTPTAAKAPGPVRAIAGGYFHSLFAQGDGTVLASGWNPLGQLGDGTLTDRSTAMPVTGLTGVTAVAAGAVHSLALKADGTVWAWGWNVAGQLGDGTTTDRRTPVQVTGLPKIAAISAGAYHSAALGTDGSVWTWGWNAIGQLGDGTTTDRWSPVRLAGLTGAIAVSAGAFHTLATKDLYAWGWGWNAVGQLGDGTTTDRLSPVRGPYVSGGTATAGAYHSLAEVYGTVLAWGWNGAGQLGVPSAAAITTEAVTIPGLTGIISLSAGLLHNLALARDGTVWAWGWNGFGTLCDGTTLDRPAPVRVAALHGSEALSVGAAHTLTLR